VARFKIVTTAGPGTGVPGADHSLEMEALAAIGAEIVEVKGGEDELAAAHRSVEEMRVHIGATSLHYLSVEGMQEATQLPDDSVCRACFTRDYPTRVPQRVEKPRFETARA
jgi:hypothetical protein